MIPGAANIHATAVVLGTRGVLFVGPSGSGKSTTAFACIAAARRNGAFAALVADDQVIVSLQRDCVLALRPAPIAGLVEVRGSGIARVESLEAAVMDLAVRVLSSPEEERLPPEHERFPVGGGADLPLMRLWRATPEPLAVIGAFASDFRGQTPFR